MPPLQQLRLGLHRHVDRAAVVQEGVWPPHQDAQGVRRHQLQHRLDLPGRLLLRLSSRLPGRPAPRPQDGPPPVVPRLLPRSGCHARRRRRARSWPHLRRPHRCRPRNVRLLILFCMDSSAGAGADSPPPPPCSGAASNLTPLYISEISPPAIRGQLVGMYEIGWQSASFSRSSARRARSATDPLLLPACSRWSRRLLDQLRRHQAHRAWHHAVAYGACDSLCGEGLLEGPER